MLDPVLLGTIATCYGVCGALAALCQALACQPGDLLRWEPEDAMDRAAHAGH